MKKIYRFKMIFLILIVIVIFIGFVWVSKLGLVIRHLDRIVTVKGLAEREVLADIGILDITFMNWAKDLKIIGESSKKSIQLISTYLKKQGYNANEIEVGNFNLYRDIRQVANSALYREQFQKSSRITSLKARKKTQSNNSEPLIYEGSIRVKTTNVLKLRNLEREIYTLIGQGVMITSHRAQYIYTKIKDIKPILLEEAIENAKQSALVFTRNSTLKLGKIQKADQGVIEILPTDYASYSNTNAFREPQVPNKIVRIVVTIQYTIDSWGI